MHGRRPLAQGRGGVAPDVLAGHGGQPLRRHGSAAGRFRAQGGQHVREGGRPERIGQHGEGGRRRGLGFPHAQELPTEPRGAVAVAIEAGTLGATQQCFGADGQQSRRQGAQALFRRGGTETPEGRDRGPGDVGVGVRGQAGEVVQGRFVPAFAQRRHHRGQFARRESPTQRGAQGCADLGVGQPTERLEGGRRQLLTADVLCQASDDLRAAAAPEPAANQRAGVGRRRAVVKQLEEFRLEWLPGSALNRSDLGLHRPPGDP